MIRIMRRRGVPVAALLVAIGCAVAGQHARAEVTAIQDWSGTMQYTAQFKGVTGGYEFTVGDTPVIVTKLGFFDHGANGLSESHEVGIWKLGDTTALTTATITTTSPLEGPMIHSAGRFRFEELASTVGLSANTTYRIGAYYSSTHNDPWAQSSGAVSWTTASEVTYGNPRYNYGSGLAYPDNLGARDLAYIGPNFQFVAKPQEHNYYRMETDAGMVVSPGQTASVVDDTGLFLYHGTALPAAAPPSYSSSVPGPLVVRDGVETPNLTSLSFSGAGDYVELGNQPFLKSLPEDDFTIEFFLKTPLRGDRSILVGTYDAAEGNSNYVLNLEIGGSGTNQGKLRAFLEGGSSSARTDFWGATSISDDEWHHVALVRSGAGTASDRVELFVDYELDAWRALNTGQYTIGPDLFRLGRDSRGTGHYYEGLLDEFRISRVALDVSEFLRAVPEPGTGLMLLAAAAGLLLRRRRRR